MLDASGYLKIVDFGSSKLLPLSDKTRSMVGSPEYLAPEMILCKEYNRAVDIWSFGVFVFELLTRTTPYQHNNLVSPICNYLECFLSEFWQCEGVHLSEHHRNRRNHFLSVSATRWLWRSSEDYDSEYSPVQREYSIRDATSWIARYMGFSLSFRLTVSFFQLSRSITIYFIN